MPMWFEITFGLALMVVGTALFIAAFLLWAYSEKRAYREPRIILCPENHEYASVIVDGAQAFRTMIAGKQEYRIAACSRWPEKQECDQGCAAQVPLVGDDRVDGQYAAFGMTPDQLRSANPVRMAPALFDEVTRQEAERHVHKKSA